MDIRTIKERARVSLERRLFGNVWLTLVIATFLSGILLGLPSAISTLLTHNAPAVGALLGFPLMLVGAVISGPISYGVSRLFHKVALGDKKPDLAELFCGFREEVGETFLLGILRSIYIFLWSLLLIVPGIIKAYAYSMAFFIQQEAKDKNWRTCLDESAALTDGYKGKLFVMDLTFIGWYLLGALCFGVGVLWVEAYHSEARAHFYEELKKIKFGPSEEAPADQDPFRADESAPTSPYEELK